MLGYDRHVRTGRKGLWPVAALAASAAIAVAGCSSTGAGAPSDDIGGGGRGIDSVTWALSKDFNSLDYPTCFDFQCLTIVPNVTESLFRLDENNVPQPNLATGYTYKSPTVLTINIRQGVTFHDGSPLTVDDVVFSLKRHTDPAVGSYVGYFFDKVADIRPSGPSQIEIDLTEPDTRLLPSLGTTAGEITSRAFVEAHGAAVGTPPIGIMGTGPYKFESWTKGESTTIVRNDQYWDKSRPLKVAKFTARVLGDESSIISGLHSGDVDGVFETELSGRAIASLQSVRGVTVNRKPGAGIAALDFNTQQAPFNDVRVRQALKYALDRKALLASVGGGVGAIVPAMVPNSLYSYGETIFTDAAAGYPPAEQDLDRAKTLVADAGATGATTELWITSINRTAALVVQEAAKKIGLTVNIREVPAPDFHRAIARPAAGKQHPYGMTLHLFAADLMEPYGLLGFSFLTDGPLNTTSYANPEFDKLMAAARAEVDDAARAKIMVRAEQLLYADLPAIPLYSPDAALVRRSSIGGYALRPLWSWDSFVADLSGS